jgi:gluconate 2-dehydrogenase gamma chain
VRLSNIRTLARLGALPPAWRALHEAARTAATRGAGAAFVPAAAGVAAGVAAVARTPVTRRRVLKMIAGTVAVAAQTLTWPGLARAARRRRGRFFTAHEYATIEAATARFFPTDDTPGAREAGVVDYIDGLLSAFRRRGVPLVFAGGPFSDRNPFPDPATGTPSMVFPRNEFARFVPLTRVRRIAWQAVLNGSRRVRRARFADAVLGPLPGLRRLYRDGVRELDAVARTMFGMRFVELSGAQQDLVLGDLADLETHPREPRTEKNFYEQLLGHAAQGMYCPPEYLGNRDLAGWRSIAFDGDSQPLGFSIFDATAEVYRERPGKPMAGPNPDEVETPAPFTEDAEAFVNLIVTILGGFGPEPPP